MPKNLSMQALESDELRFVRIEARARELLDLHGLTALGWTFEMSSSQRRLGVCKYRPKRIEFSTHYEHIPWDEIEDTLLHEIAHALVGPRHGHDQTWKQKCREIGAKPTRLADESIESAAEPNYEIVCTGCGQSFKRYRLRPALLNRYHCSECGGKFEAYSLG